VLYWSINQIFLIMKIENVCFVFVLLWKSGSQLGFGSIYDSNLSNHMRSGLVYRCALISLLHRLSTNNDERPVDFKYFKLFCEYELNLNTYFCLFDIESFDYDVCVCARTWWVRRGTVSFPITKSTKCSSSSRYASGYRSVNVYLNHNH
jgi:hypothetical protein